jgi:prophage regulatory protein
MSSESTPRVSKQVISTDEVLARTALSKSMLYKLLRQEKFPLPTPMSNRSIGWFAIDVESWLQNSRAARHISLALPLIYMAGSMRAPKDSRKLLGDISYWQNFEASISNAPGDMGAGHILLGSPQETVFHGTRTRFMYSGPWTAQKPHHDRKHEGTSASADSAQNAAYLGALQGISRADAVVAYLEDLHVYGTLVEIGYARAAKKRVIVITSPALQTLLSNGWDNGLWVAIRAADRYIELPDQPGSTPEDHWRLAHANAAMTIAEWYPHTVVSAS